MWEEYQGRAKDKVAADAKKAKESRNALACPRLSRNCHLAQVSLSLCRKLVWEEYQGRAKDKAAADAKKAK